MIFLLFLIFLICVIRIPIDNELLKQLSLMRVSFFSSDSWMIESNYLWHHLI